MRAAFVAASVLILAGAFGDLIGVGTTPSVDIASAVPWHCGEHKARPCYVILVD